MKNLNILLALSLGLAAACPSAHGQTITPQPAAEGDAITLWAVLPQMSCFNRIEATEVSRSGASVSVQYTVVQTSGVTCFTVNPPLSLEVSVGSFVQGSYTVRIEGTSSGVPNPPQFATFLVGALGSGLGPVSIPGTSVWSIAIGVFFLLAFARARLTIG